MMTVRNVVVMLLVASCLQGMADGGCGSGVDMSGFDDSKIVTRGVADVSGVVVDANDREPVAGASVRVADKTTSTDNAGVFFLGEVTTGQQTLSIQAAGYAAYSRVIELDKGANALGEISLATNTENQLAAPANVSASQSFEDHILLQWDVVPQATSYAVLRSASHTGGFVELDTSSTNAYTDSPLPPSTQYFYQVTASASGYQTSEPSVAAEGRTTADDLPQLEQPSAVDASDGIYSDMIEITWAPVANSETYRLEYSANATGPWSLLVALDNTLSVHSSLAAGVTYWYRVIATGSGYADSPASEVEQGSTSPQTAEEWKFDSYIKASNTETYDYFGNSIALSADGNTMAVGAYAEDGGGTGTTGNQDDNSLLSAGAVYVLTKSFGVWSQQAYIKAANTGEGDLFGIAVALSADGDTLVVGAPGESSGDTGVNADPTDNSVENAGAVYVFTRNGTAWTQQAYVKASNAGASDLFGATVALSEDGDTMAVGAYGEWSSDTGVNADPMDNSAQLSGAAYVFTRNGGTWTQQAYVKASNTGASDMFSCSLALSGDGNTMAVGARGEDSEATGLNGIGSNNEATDAGAVYVFARSGSVWTQQVYAKASNAEIYDEFGGAVTLSQDGNTLAVGARNEDSRAKGINGDQTENFAQASGAAYVFSRSGSTWIQQAYVKASNTEASDDFGFALAMSADGNTLVVGATAEGSTATGINGDQTDNSAFHSGAAYVFTRDSSTWAQKAYVKATNPDAYDGFGSAVAISADGNTFSIQARYEDSRSKGINGDQYDDVTAESSGAVYTYIWE